VEQLRRHLTEASDEEVVKMRPFALADRWKLDRWEVLRLFLHATVAGLVVLSWDVLCPNCRVGKAEYFSLRDLKVEAHCDVCNIRFDADFDRSVEVRFTVAPALRQVSNRMYCIGGPQNTPHILAQTLVPAGGAEQLTVRLDAGSYRLRSPRSKGGLVLEVSPSESDSMTPPAGQGRAAPEPDEAPLQRCQLTISARAIEPSRVRVDPGPLQLVLSNVSRLDQLAVLEVATWPDTVATAAMVSSLQEFRDLFSSEVLAPGLQLGIETLAFMFTDLTGSTAMYQAVGQARAFRLVQDHFQILGAAINANRGALVKTIGDAVMATFPSGTDALAASLQIQRDIRGLDVPDEVDPTRLVKVGLHQGPCLAVTLNERLDYFGSTVNTAARIEHECRGGQIVASLAVCQTEQARRLLEQSDTRLEEEVVRLRGVAEPVPVYRITPP
jgi:class 3 adenylate cyclase